MRERTDPQIVKVFADRRSVPRYFPSYPGHTSVPERCPSTGHAARATEGPQAGDSSLIHTEKSMRQLVNAIDELVEEMDEASVASLES
jgi:hypothetical protein